MSVPPGSTVQYSTTLHSGAYLIGQENISLSNGPFGVITLATLTISHPDSGRDVVLRSFAVGREQLLLDNVHCSQLSVCQAMSLEGQNRIE